MDPAVQAIYESLPDRALELSGKPNRQSTYEDQDYPGEFSVEEIRIIAAKLLGVDQRQLLNLITDRNLPRPGSNVIPEPGELCDELVCEITDGGANRAEQFVLPLTTIFCAGEIMVWLQKLDVVSSQHGISRDAVRKYFTQLLSCENSRIGFDLVLFESNLAIDEGFVEKGPLDRVEGELRKLWKDPAYQIYLNEKYPLLGHHLRRRTKFIGKMLEELVQRLGFDLPAIKTKAGIPKNADVEALKGSLGDSHNGGARVSIIEFSGGQKIVYKPRGVGGEAAFQRYLSWINSKSSAGYRCLWVIERPNYGWMEFVSPDELLDFAEADTYFARYGGLIAIINSIAGTDIHYENLVAVGSQPVVVDLETIVQPLEYAPSEDGQKRYLLNFDYFAHTPLFTGMFDPAFLDRSLSGSPLSEVYIEATTVTDIGINLEGRLEALHSPVMCDVMHMPRYKGESVSFSEYVDVIVSAYHDMATLIARNRRELLNHVVNDLFGKLSVRVIFRYTAHYSSYLNALYSPYAMQSISNSEEILSKLWRVALVSPASAPIILSEYRDLWDGDIPFFKVRVDETIIRDSRGGEIAGVLRVAGMSSLRERMIKRGISAIDDETQLLDYCLKQKVRDIKTASARAVKEGESPSLPRTWRGLMQVMADRILIEGARVLFMDPVMERDLSTSQNILGNDFYTGLPGVVFSLAYCGRYAECRELDEKIRTLADMAFLRADSLPSEIGVCKGMGGLIYLAAHLGAIWSDPYYWDVGTYIAKYVAKVLYTDRHFDIFSGAAGALLAVDALASVMPGDDLEGVIDQLASHLITHSAEHNGQVTWLSSIPSSGPTTGFAHGVSGIAYALLRAYRRLKKSEIKAAIVGAERFIDSCSYAGPGAWYECYGDRNPQTMEVWCHGAPGIAQFYDELARQFPEYRGKADSALQSASRFAQFENDSICHGTLGNIDLLLSHLRGGYSDGDGSKRLEIIDTINSISSDLQTRDLRCGNERKHLSLSFFNGLSGCAYQMLRIEQAGVIPSAAVFEGPNFYGY